MQRISRLRFRIRESIPIPCFLSPRIRYTFTLHSLTQRRSVYDTLDDILWIFDHVCCWNVLQWIWKTNDDANSLKFSTEIAYTRFKFSRVQSSHKHLRGWKFRFHTLSVIILYRIHMLVSVNGKTNPTWKHTYRICSQSENFCPS